MKNCFYTYFTSSDLKQFQNLQAPKNQPPNFLIIYPKEQKDLEYTYRNGVLWLKCMIYSEEVISVWGSDWHRTMNIIDDVNVYKLTMYVDGATNRVVIEDYMCYSSIDGF